MIAASSAVAFAVAVLAAVVWEGDLRGIFGITLMVIAALIAMTGSSMMTRSGSSAERAMMGLAPDNEDPASGAALAPVGVFLFVSVPLFVIGGLLYGTG